MKRILLWAMLLIGFTSNAQSVASSIQYTQLMYPTYYIVNEYYRDTCLITQVSDSIREITVSCGDQLLFKAESCSTCFYVWKSGNEFIGAMMGYGFYQYSVTYTNPGVYNLTLCKYPDLPEMQILVDKIRVTVISP